MHSDGAHRVDRGLHIENLVEQDGVFIYLAAFDFDEALAYWLDESNSLVMLRIAEKRARLVVVLPSFIRVAAMKIRLVVLLRGAVKISVSSGSVKSFCLSGMYSE